MTRAIRRLLIVFLLLCYSPAGYGEEVFFSFSGAEEEMVESTHAPDAQPQPTSDPDAQEPLEVHLLNVASADSVLLVKGGKSMLLDAGNYSESDRILRYLDELGITKLDFAMFSHPHGDHIQGFAAVLEAVEVGVFLEPTLYENYGGEGADYLEIIHGIMEEKDIPIHIVGHLDKMDFGGATIQFFQWKNPDALINNRSMIARVSFGNSAILLAADIGSHAQKALAEELGTMLQADILKMPHHGMASYTLEFHDAVQPKLATISNVRGNEAVEEQIGRLEARGVEWMLTTEGTIVCTTDGTQWLIKQL